MKTEKKFKVNRSIIKEEWEGKEEGKEKKKWRRFYIYNSTHILIYRYIYVDVDIYIYIYT